MIHEKVVMTDAYKQALARRENKAAVPDRAFSLDTLQSNAEILRECGGQAALVFRAILGSYSTAGVKQREKGFTLLPLFAEAIGVPDRQRQRAYKTLATAGYVELEQARGRKARFRLTEKGKHALIQTPGRKSQPL